MKYNKIPCFIIFQSRNGTFVNEQQLVDGEMELKHNDLLSFGFNTSKIYNIRDRNAFIYRVMKDDIETIDLGDSDEDDVDSNIVIEIDSDSDSHQSLDEEIEEENSECDLQNIDDDIVISSDDGDDIYEGSDDIDYNEDDASNDSGDFVVTDVIVNSENNIEAENESNFANRKIENLEVGKKENQIMPNNDNVKPKTNENGSSEAIVSTNSSKLVDKTQDDFQARIDRVKESINRKRQKNIAIIAPQPLKKRRRTVTEQEYEDMNARKYEKKTILLANQLEDKHVLAQKRAERLAQVAHDQKEAKKALLSDKDEDIRRAVVTPRVKNTQMSRAEMLTMEMLTTPEPRK